MAERRVATHLTVIGQKRSERYTYGVDRRGYVRSVDGIVVQPAAPGGHNLTVYDLLEAGFMLEASISQLPGRVRENAAPSRPGTR